MSPVDEKDRYVMSDDERATIGRRPPAKIAKGGLVGFLLKIPTAWKVLTVIAAVFAAGVAGHAYIVDYTAKYATREDLRKHVDNEAEIRDQIRILRESDAARSADIASIKTDTAAVREDIRTLLQYMLSNPPARNGTSRKGKSP